MHFSASNIVTCLCLFAPTPRAGHVIWGYTLTHAVTTVTFELIILPQKQPDQTLPLHVSSYMRQNFNPCLPSPQTDTETEV